MKSFEAKDLFRHRTLTKLSGSFHHDALVWTVGRARKKKDGYERAAWGMRGDESAPRQLTSVEFSIVSPEWSHDGRTLAFVSDRGDAGAQVHLLQAGGGEAVRLTDAKETIGALQGWWPDDRSLLLTARVEWSEDNDPDLPDGRRSPQVATCLPYKRDGSGIIVGERTHLFRADIDNGELAALTEGDFDVSTARCAPDGRRIAYARNRCERRRHRDDLRLVDADGGNAHCRMDALASISQVAWSPDGRWLAIGGIAEEGDSVVNLWLLDVDGDAPPRRLGGEDFELEPTGALLWHPDGERLCVVSSHRGVPRLAFVSTADGAVRHVERGLQGVSECANWGERIAFVSSSQRRLEEVHSIDWEGGDERRHSRFNRWFRKRARPHVSMRRFRVPDGAGGEETIDAWVLRPPGAQGRTPLLVDMHGGPHSTVLIDFSAHTYWYCLLAQGWTIVAPNAVGSASYGKAFARRLRGRWGKLDLPQYEAVVRALQDAGLADGRVACAGKSYGGFLSAWAIGHSHRFKAAVVSAPVSNMLSHFGTSDTGYYAGPYMIGAEFPADPARWHAQSAVVFLHRATTPTLILQGENDGRCPRGQSEEVFAHLIRYTDVPCELVVYPTSSHAEAESGRPSNRLDYHGRIADWVTRWTREEDKPEPAAHAGTPQRLEA